MFTPDSKLPQIGTTIFSVVTQRANELGAINLAQGFPDFPPPVELSQSLLEVATLNGHQYAPMTGIDALREQISRICKVDFGIDAVPIDDITITLGATEGLFSSITALVQPGDEVIVFDPSYDSYAPAIRVCGATAVQVPLLPPAFSVDWQRVKDSVSPRTRMIIVNNPHNPTGAVWSPDDLDELAAIVRDTGIVILSDEVYANMVYDGRRHCSLQAHAELRERTISVFSFGKVLHATGWRVGYTLAPPNLTKEVRRVHQFNTFSIAHPLQLAITQFLKVKPDHVSGLAAFYQHKRDQFLSSLAASRFRATPSPGTYFQLLDYSAVSDVGDMAFAEQLLHAGVAAIPLSPFYEQPPSHRYLRFCFAKRAETLEKAAAILCGL
jgi:methionine aminotransferase